MHLKKTKNSAGHRTRESTDTGAEMHLFWSAAILPKHLKSILNLHNGKLSNPETHAKLLVCRYLTKGFSLKVSETCLRSSSIEFSYCVFSPQVMSWCKHYLSTNVLSMKLVIYWWHVENYEEFYTHVHWVDNPIHALATNVCCEGILYIC